MKKVWVAVCLLLLVSGCTTSAKIKIPSDSHLYLNSRAEPATINSNGAIRTFPFSWGAIPGIPFKLEKDGKVILQGRLRAHLRVASIFWPPLALIYAPVRFGEPEYDLTDVSQDIAKGKVVIPAAPSTPPAQKTTEVQKHEDGAKQAAVGQ